MDAFIDDNHHSVAILIMDRINFTHCEACMKHGLVVYLLLLTGDMLYIPQYWWHFVQSYNAPNIALNVWFAIFNFEQQFHEAGISEDTDVTKVTCFNLH